MPFINGRTALGDLSVSQMSRRPSATPVQPEKAPEHDEGGCHKDEDKRRLLDPGNSRNRQRHDNAQNTGLPGKRMDARDKSSKREKEEGCKPGGVGVQQLLDIAVEQKVHGGKKGRPVQNLRPDKPDTAFFPSAGPAAYDAQKSYQDSQDLPVIDQRLFVNAGIGNPEKSQDQDEEIGQCLDKAGGSSFDLSMIRWC